ncbi:uncharacterized protein [Oscarella lobularis]|uniref:uncharacterized protein n=1 Tax=Oscarella lobularis TaxID=121494 RepID=UPI0033143662
MKSLLLFLVVSLAAVDLSLSVPTPTVPKHGNDTDLSCSKAVRCTLAPHREQRTRFSIDGSPYVHTNKCKRECLSDKSSSVATLHGLSPFVSEAVKKCRKRYTCYGSHSHVEQYTMLSGEHEEHLLIKTCACVSARTSCQRAPRFLTYYPGTSYERTIDHGQCTGNRCEKSGHSCVSFNRTVALDSPNGPRTVEVIDSCACQKSCYRAPHYDVFRETRRNETTGEIIATTKMIDVGKCLGLCELPKKDCSDARRRGFYYFILCTGSSELCAAATTTKVTVNSADSDDPTVVSVIKSCACRSEAMFGKRK